MTDLLLTDDEHEKSKSRLFIGKNGEISQISSVPQVSLKQATDSPVSP